jgi:hypothetical protein
MIRLQISKLEKIQQGELSRSRSNTRNAQSFNFNGAQGFHERDDKSRSLSPNSKTRKRKINEHNRSVNVNPLRASLKES